MQLISRLPKYTTLYEPFHPLWFPQTKQCNVGPRPFVWPGEDAPAIRDYLQALFAGNITGIYPQYHRNFIEVFKRVNASKMVIKFVRGNRLLPWITQNIQMRATIFLVRNPYATVASQMRTGISGYYGDNSIPSADRIAKEAWQSGCMNKTVCKFLEELQDKEEYLAAIWALDHVVPLSFEQSHAWYFLGYEKLCSRPKVELGKVFDWLGEPRGLEKAIKQVDIPSVSTPTSDRGPSQNQRGKQDVLSYESYKKIERVLDIFSVCCTEDQIQVGDQKFALGEGPG